MKNSNVLEQTIMKRYKINNKILGGALALAALASPLMFSSCTDTIQFGNSFLEKAPGGDINEDTVLQVPYIPSSSSMPFIANNIMV